MRSVSLVFASMIFFACGDKTQANKPSPQPAPKTETKPAPPKTDPPKTEPATSAATPPAPATPGANEKTVLYDGRLVTQADGAVKVQPVVRGKPASGIDGAVLAKIEATVFPKRLAAIEACKGDDEGSIANGQFVAILSAVSEEGSFTAAGKAQTLYLYDVELCNRSAADSNMGYVVIAEKDAVIFQGERDYPTLDRVLDVTGDGLLDAMFSGGGMGQGVLVISGELVSFAGGAAGSLKRFDEIVEDVCGADDTGEVSASVIYYQRDASMAVSYTEERYAASCKDPKAFSLKK